MVSSEEAEISGSNTIKATMEKLSDDERQAYLIAEEHLKEQFLQGFKKERGGLFKRVGEFVMPSSCRKYALEAIIEMIIFPCIHD